MFMCAVFVFVCAEFVFMCAEFVFVCAEFVFLCLCLCVQSSCLCLQSLCAVFVCAEFVFVCAEFVCPTLGYSEFLHADWLTQILSWQKPVGCWGTATASGSKQGHSLKSGQKLLVPVNTDVGPQQEVNVGLQPPAFKTRQLLYEKAVSGNHLFC